MVDDSVKELFVEEVCALFEGERCGLVVEMFERGNSVTASGCAKGVILSGLEALALGGGDPRGPGRGGVFKNGAGDGFVGSHKGFFLLTPFGIR